MAYATGWSQVPVCAVLSAIPVIFTVLHGMSVWTNEEKVVLSVSLSLQSICLSVKYVDCDKMEEKSVQIFIPYERPFSLVF